MTTTIALFVLAALDVAAFMWAVGQTNLLDDARVDIDNHRQRIDDLTADLHDTNARIDALKVKPTPTKRTDTVEAAAVIATGIGQLVATPQDDRRGRHAATEGQR